MGDSGSGDSSERGAIFKASCGAEKEGGAARDDGGDPGGGWTRVDRGRKPKLKPPAEPSGANGTALSGQKLPSSARRHPQTRSGTDRSRIPPRNEGTQKLVWKALSTQPTSVGKQPINWKSACFSSSIAVDESRKLCFTPPVIIGGAKIAALAPEDILEAKMRWNHTIVGYIMGRRPYFPHLKENVERQWKIKGSLGMFARAGGFFVFRFSLEEDYTSVLNNGPWFYDGRLMILKPWNATHGMDKDLLNSIPVWVRLPGLNLQAWTIGGIGKIASVIGGPLLLDKQTASMERLEYARCLIEIEATQEPLHWVTVGLEDGNSYPQEVVYEWMPPRCNLCSAFGHLTRNCLSSKSYEVSGAKSPDPPTVCGNADKFPALNLQRFKEAQLKSLPSSTKLESENHTPKDKSTSSTSVGLVEPVQPAVCANALVNTSLADPISSDMALDPINTSVLNPISDHPGIQDTDMVIHLSSQDISQFNQDTPLFSPLSEQNLDSAPSEGHFNRSSGKLPFKSANLNQYSASSEGHFTRSAAKPSLLSGSEIQDEGNLPAFTKENPEWTPFKNRAAASAKGSLSDTLYGGKPFKSMLKRTIKPTVKTDFAYDKEISDILRDKSNPQQDTDWPINLLIKPKKVSRPIKKAKRVTKTPP